MPPFVTALLRAGRSLVRSPGYLVAALLTSALGIGALTAVVSLISTALLEPLPYPNAARLALVQETRRERTISVSWLNLQDFRARTRTFEALAAFSGTSVNLTVDGNTERVVADMVTANLFDVLGVRPMLGRAFRDEEDRPGSGNVVVLGHALWATRFGSDSGIVGRIITLSGERFEVVGVMPAGFRFADGIVYDPADAWLPMNRLSGRVREERGEHPGLVGIGKLRTGATVEMARAELTNIAADLVREYPHSNVDQSVRVDGTGAVILGGVRGGLLLMLGAVALLVLITCANVAGLALARTVSRGRELAIRLALGSDRRRLATDLVMGTLIPGLLGGLAGLGLGWGILRVFAAYVSRLPRLADVGIDWRVFAIVSGASVLASLVSAIAPVVWARKIDVEKWLRSKGVDATSARTRRMFVTGQVAMSLVLLTVAGLLMRSFVAL